MRNENVKLSSGFLDDHDSRGGTIILRGIIDLSTLEYIRQESYQRERFSLGELKPLLDGLKQGQSLPDIELGMRGQDYRENNGVFTLKNNVYVIDGLQRCTAVGHHMTTDPTANIRLGALIHFDTTVEWEMERFRILNTQRRKVSPNILLRNARQSSNAMASLFGLSTSDSKFALRDRVTWNQNAARNDLITALTLVRTVGLLHTHKGTGLRSTVWKDMIGSLDKLNDVVGMQNVRDNTIHFFDVIDEAWGIRKAIYRTNSAHLKGTFLYVLANFFADHRDFWRSGPDEKRLFVDAPLRKKLAAFPITTDTMVMNLASSGGKAREHLYQLLRDHVNSGKRTKRLESRRPMGEINFDDIEDMAA